MMTENELNMVSYDSVFLKKETAIRKELQTRVLVPVSHITHCSDGGGPSSKWLVLHFRLNHSALHEFNDNK